MQGGGSILFVYIYVKREHYTEYSQGSWYPGQESQSGLPDQKHTYQPS
jgi:hypothetical protein